MANFTSQQLKSLETTTGITTGITTLTGSSNWAPFMRDIKTHFATNFGQIGTDINNNVDTEFDEAGPPPGYNDPRTHPTTGLPIENSRKYRQRDMTQQEQADQFFDTQTLELTQESEKKLESDTAIWQAAVNRCERKHDILKTHDDAALNYILNHMSPLCKETVKTNPLIAAFKDLPFECVTRAGDYLHILEQQYSRGNSTTTINEVTKLFEMTELPNIDTPATFINKVREQQQSVMPLIESKDYEGHVEINKLLTMVLIKGFSRLNAATVNALRIHMQTYPGTTSLDHPDELITNVLAMQDSDLATLGTTQSTLSQSTDDELTSAFSATPAYNKPKPGKIHCTNCFGLTNNYYYGHTASQCKRTLAAKTTSPANAGITSQANLATPPPAMTSTQAFAYLATQGYEFTQILPDEQPTPQAFSAGILTEDQAFDFLQTQGYEFENKPITRPSSLK